MTSIANIEFISFVNDHFVSIFSFKTLTDREPYIPIRIRIGTVFFDKILV